MSFPSEGMELTHLLVVKEMERSKGFYHDVLGATVFRKYGGTSCVLQFLGNWILLVTPGGPTEDKPEVSFRAPSNPNDANSEMIIRVPDCQEAYQILESRGAPFLTPPYDWGQEIRCFFRDPDGHLLEISEVNSPRHAIQPPSGFSHLSSGNREKSESHETRAAP